MRPEEVMRVRRVIVFAASALLVAASVARSGHELPVYPSYYPHEIAMSTVAPDTAFDLVRTGKLHAYVGTLPTPAAAESVGQAESLGSFIVVRLNPDSPRTRDDAAACAVATAVMREVAANADGKRLIVHPYPVTPWHGDYLHHVDRAEAARQRLLAGDATAMPDQIKLRIADALAGLVRREWLADGGSWDAAIEDVSVADLVAEATTSTNAWLGPRFARSGWFHAYRLLGDAMTDPDRRQMEARAARLKTADYGGEVERINLERDLVQSLASNCRAMVVGYRTKVELFNTQYSAGIENISFDALEGLRSPMFLRTVKLKDFPWNGSLQLGVETRAGAAWNPVAGFTDPFGRLVWYALADPAAIPSPNDAGWTLNRISEVEAWPRP
jgi:hypothetical protein